MSGPLGSSQWMYKSEDFTIDQSFKFDGGSYIQRTPSSTGNRRTWTFSCWVKGAPASGSQTIFDFRDGDGGSSDTLKFQDGTLRFILQDGTNGRLVTNALFRDLSAWYHIVVAEDSTQGTNTNRSKVYVNGTQITSFSGTITYPSQNADSRANWTSADMRIGHSRNPDNSTEELNAYLAEVHHIDGTALTPTSFGETGDYGEWKPKEYSGSYGTNGFYLPFKQDYTVEGFSANTWKGKNSANAISNYIGGVGFSPDIIWQKSRDGTTDHYLWTSFLGWNVDTPLRPNATNGQGLPNWSYDHLTGISADGFSLEGGQYGSAYIDRAEKYVGWCWDMGGAGSATALTSQGGATQSTTQTKFNDYSLAFDNSDDAITAELSEGLGTGDFTVEMWFYPTSLANYDTYISVTRNSNGWNAGTDANGMAVWYNPDSGRILESASGTFAVNNWYHVAYVRFRGTLKVYVNGVEKDSASDSINYSEQTFAIGCMLNSSNGRSEFMGGYLDDVRISKRAVYTEAFNSDNRLPNRRLEADGSTILLVRGDGGGTTFTDYSTEGGGLYANNSNGTITSNVKANTTYGQSIVSYNGNGTAGATVGHGLGTVPEMIIVKRRDGTDNWPVHHANAHASSPEDYHLYLDGTNTATDNHVQFHDTLPTSSVFTIGDNDQVNNSAGEYIAFCFDSVTGYSKFGTYSGSGSAGNAQTLGFKPAFLMLKRTDSTGNWFIQDNARNPSNPVDKSLRANSTAVEDDLSTNYQMTFTDTGFSFSNYGYNESGSTYIYMAFADKREYAYWLDQSGNNNDFTSYNLTESDISVDSPTNNFATMNPLWQSHLRMAYDTGTLSEGNLHMEIEQHGGYWINRPATMASTNLDTYFEVLWTLREGSNALFSVWVGNKLANSAEGYGTFTKYEGDGDVVRYIDSGSGSELFSGDAPVQGDIIGCAVDDTNVKFYLNNVLQTTQAHQISGEDFFCGVMVYENGAGGNCHATVNFGQDSSFGGRKTAQGNQDGNDIGDFYYTPPTGYLALCTSNLAAATVTPSEHFDVALYSGNGSTQNITSLGFQPDFTWIKNREQDDSHQLFDAVRGVTKTLHSNSTAAETTNADTLTHFLSNGFTTGDDVVTNTSGEAYVSWNWKANGSGSANTVGTEDSTVSVNTDAGFSIVAYEGAGGSSKTVGHGLSKAPEIVFIKNRDGTDGWIARTGVIDGSSDFLVLESTGAKNDSGIALPSSTVINLGSGGNDNSSGSSYIAYCFHSVDGYSKVGSYEGNGNDDGPFVYLGFRPRFIIIKTADDIDAWVMYDSERGWRLNSDLRNYVIYPNNDPAETEHGSTSTYAEFMSNGVKLRDDDNLINKSGDTYIYLAFAETPFKYSNAGQYTSSPV